MYVFKYAEHNGGVHNGQFWGQEVKNIKLSSGVRCMGAGPC